MIPLTKDDELVYNTRQWGYSPKHETREDAMKIIERIIYGLVLFGLVGMGLCIWGLAANNITYWQRQSLIKKVYEQGAKDRAANVQPETAPWRALDSGAYGDHFWKVMTLQDPCVLYSPAVRRMCEE